MLNVLSKTFYQSFPHVWGGLDSTYCPFPIYFAAFYSPNNFTSTYLKALLLSLHSFNFRHTRTVSSDWHCSKLYVDSLGGSPQAPAATGGSEAFKREDEKKLSGGVSQGQEDMYNREGSESDGGAFSVVWLRGAGSMTKLRIKRRDTMSQRMKGRGRGQTTPTLTSQVENGNLI